MDARDGGISPPDRPWDAHLDSCERCQAASDGFEALGDEIEAWAPPPSASPASLARLHRLGASAMQTARYRASVGRIVRVAFPLGLAASALAMAWLGSTPDGGSRRPDRAIARRFEPSSAINPIRPDRRASGGQTEGSAVPAGRIARKLLDLGPVFASRPPARHPSTIAPEFAADRPRAPERRPFSDSARHAFGFLLGPEAPGSAGDREGL